MTEPLPTPPSRFAFAGLTGLPGDFEENPFDAVFGQKSSATAPVTAAVSGSAGESLLSTADKDAPLSTPYLSSASLLNTPPPSISQLVVTPTAKTGDSYFDVVKIDTTAPYLATTPGGTVIPTNAPLAPTNANGADPNLGLRLLADAPVTRGPMSRPQMAPRRDEAATVMQVPPKLPNKMGRPRQNAVGLPQPPQPAMSQSQQKRRVGQALLQPPQTMAQMARAPPGRPTAASTGNAKKRSREDSYGEGDESDEKRKQFLIRNKLAASKCRAKKKKWMSELETRAKELTAANSELHAQLARLRQESEILREILLAHRDCNCVKIQQFVQSSTSKMHLLTAALPSAVMQPAGIPLAPRLPMPPVS